MSFGLHYTKIKALGTDIYLKPLKTQLIQVLLFSAIAVKYTLSIYQMASISYKNVSARIYSQLSLAKNVKMAIYSQLSLAKNVKMAIYSQLSLAKNC